MSVHAAVTATQARAPAEKALLSHVQYLRELLDKQILRNLIWFDTRDMVTDGLTKGSVERSAIDTLMAGNYQYNHAPVIWRSKVDTGKFPRLFSKTNNTTRSLFSVCLFVHLL